MDLTFEIDREIKKVKGFVTAIIILVPALFSAVATGIILTEDEIAFLMNEPLQEQYEIDYQKKTLIANSDKPLEREYPQNVLGARYEQIRDNKVIPTLKKMDLYSAEMVNVLMMTIHAETKGIYTRSLVHGNDYGITQINKQTYYDIFKNYLDYNKGLKQKVLLLSSKGSGENPTHEELYNDNFAIAISAVHYLRRKATPLKMQTVYHYCYAWKKHYNTHLGMGTIDKCKNGFPQEILL